MSYPPVMMGTKMKLVPPYFPTGRCTRCAGRPESFATTYESFLLHFPANPGMSRPFYTKNASRAAEARPKGRIRGRKIVTQLVRTALAFAICQDRRGG